jgi:hypothetical protein
LETESRLNALTQRLGNFGVTMTPEQLKAKDSFGKIVNQLSLGQGSLLANAGNTDAARSMQLHANPNVEMTQASREGLIDMLQGNQDARDVLRNVWNAARNPKDGSTPVPRNAFNDEIRDFTMNPLNKDGAKFDPRVFQFNRMPPASRQAFINQMSPADALQFSKNAHEAVARGWISPITNANNAQQ